MTSIIKQFSEKPVETGMFKSLTGNLYNQLLENRVQQTRNFDLNNLATADFSSIMKTVITDKNIFGKMKSTFLGHMKSHIIGAKPFLKLTAAGVGQWMGGANSTMGNLLSSSLGSFVESAFQLFQESPAPAQEYQPGDYFAIDVVQNKNPSRKIHEDVDQFTLGFFVDHDTTSRKLFIFIYEQGKVMAVQRQHARKLSEAESTRFETNDQLQFIKELFLLRYYDPISLQKEETLPKGQEMRHGKKTVYVVSNSGTRVLVEDKVGDRFEVNRNELTTLRSTQRGDFTTGQLCIIPSTLSQTFTRVLGVVSYFLGNDALVYETATGKLRRVNLYDVELPSNEVLHSVSGNRYFQKFRKMAAKGRADLKDYRIPTKYYHLCFLQGLDMDLVKPAPKRQQFKRLDAETTTLPLGLNKISNMKGVSPIDEYDNMFYPKAEYGEVDEPPYQQPASGNGGVALIGLALVAFLLISE
jgi:hypothetical protein